MQVAKARIRRGVRLTHTQNYSVAALVFQRPGFLFVRACLCCSHYSQILSKKEFKNLIFLSVFPVPISSKPPKRRIFACLGGLGYDFWGFRPSPFRAANVVFFFYWPLVRFVLQVSCQGWVGGLLFAIFSLHRCSFVTERTKGPTVSMRWTPTRGPRDPWTPRGVWSVAWFLRPSAPAHP